MKKSVAASTVLELEYSLGNLSSSQHRAGLAGLALMVRHANRSSYTGICEIEVSAFGARLRIDHAGLEHLLNETYAASQGEIESLTVRKDRNKNEIEPLETREKVSTDAKTGKEKTKKVYVYPQVIPSGAFLNDADSSPNKVHLKLWRDTVWTILRGVPATRKPFEDRANGLKCTDADVLWTQLSKFEKPVELASTYFVGAQAANSEGVKFTDTGGNQFLLHFWPFVMQVFVLKVVDFDGARKLDSGAYIIAVPDVSRLDDFCDDYALMLEQRSNELEGYRPAESVISIPEEGGLETLRQLSLVLARKAEKQQISDLVLGLDLLHTAREGNNVRLLYTARIEPVRERIDEYSAFAKSLRDPIFRQQRLLNLVRAKSWFHGFDKILSLRPVSQTVASTSFKIDVSRSFERAQQEHSMITDQEKTDRGIESMILRIVESFIFGKLEDKYDLKWDSVKGDAKKENLYREKKESIAKECFYAVRSRTGDDFINYFASTICSVPHRLKADEFVVLTRHLYSMPDQIRTLTMLALSARG